MSECVTAQFSANADGRALTPGTDVWGVAAAGDRAKNGPGTRFVRGAVGREDVMGSDGTLTGLAIAGLALFAVVVVLLVAFAALEARRWVRALGVRHAGPGPRFEVAFRSDLQVIDEAHELRPFLRQLLAEGRRDEALKLYRAFAGTEAGDAEAALDTFVRETGRQPRAGATVPHSDE